MIVRILRDFHYAGGKIKAREEIPARIALTNTNAYQIVEGPHIGAEVPVYLCFEIDEYQQYLRKRLDKAREEISELEQERSVLVQTIERYVNEQQASEPEITEVPEDKLVSEVEMMIDAWMQDDFAGSASEDRRRLADMLVGYLREQQLSG